MPLKKHTPSDEVLSPEEKRVRLHNERYTLHDHNSDRNPLNAGRPKGIHTLHRPDGRAGQVHHTPEQWAEIWANFAVHLSTTCKIVKSCELAGVSYQELIVRRRADPEFEKWFQDVYEVALQRMEDEAMRRAVDGIEKPIVYKGVICGTSLEYSDALLMFLLKGGRPEKYKDRTQNENINHNDELADRLAAARKRDDEN